MQSSRCEEKQRREGEMQTRGGGTDGGGRRDGRGPGSGAQVGDQDAEARRP